MNNKKNWFFVFLGKVLFPLLVVVLIAFVVTSKPKDQKIGEAVTIHESGFKWVKQGIITGDISINGNMALVRVKNPKNTEYFEMSVVYSPGILRAKEICKEWKTGEPILFYEDGVSSSNQQGTRSAEIGLFAAFGNWEDIRKDPKFEGYNLVNPSRK